MSTHLATQSSFLQTQFFGADWLQGKPRGSVIAAFSSGVTKAIARLLWLCFTALCDWFVKLAPFSQPTRDKTKTNRAWSYAFSRAWRRLYVFASSYDLFIALIATVMIGQSKNFGFGFTAVIWKPLCWTNYRLIYNQLIFESQWTAENFPYH